jgi:hypothetical protein
VVETVLVDSKPYLWNTDWHCNGVIFLCIVHLRDTVTELLLYSLKLYDDE